MIRGYIASSLDGFIAAPDGSFAFLERYPPDDAGYDAFVREIGTVVMGRLTYEAVLGHSEWPYAGKRSIVVTSHPPASPPPDTEAWTAGVPALVAHLAAHPGPGDVWILGGGRLQQAFLDAGAIERLEI
jgi:dihydrofolate reductase